MKLSDVSGLSKEDILSELGLANKLERPGAPAGHGRHLSRSAS